MHLGNDSVDAGKRRYSLRQGILSLVDEDKVSALDDLFQQQYGMNTAKKYDATLRLQSMIFGCWEPSQRKRLVRLLNAPKGGMVLEVAVGTGANLRPLANQIGPHGQIVAVDLSLAMLKVAKGRASTIPIPIHLARADGCHLPFVDNSFDAVFHFGGINMFGNVRQGIEEMVRVAKPDAPVIISDEGMSERRRKTWIGRRLGEMNTLNLCRPPFADIPWDHVHAFELHWAWRELFYVLSFRKGNDPKASVGTPQEEVHRRIKT
jgi:ubiquinone/menaquinone biosynthesis C-methylase UbiE